MSADEYDMGTAIQASKIEITRKLDAVLNDRQLISSGGPVHHSDNAHWAYRTGWEDALSDLAERLGIEHVVKPGDSR